MSGGRVRALATTGAERNPSLPDLPTIGSTVPGYEISQTWGIVAPAGTPPEVVARLSDEIVKAMSAAEVKERVLKTGAVPVGDRPADFAAFMAARAPSPGRRHHALRDRAQGLTERKSRSFSARRARDR
jgi:tripartite-type tricarboxylate transporter receptor subunit TctC